MKKLIIYTDGSHLKHTSGRLGIGGLIVDEKSNELISSFSEEISIDFLKKNYGTSDVSNPTCEMLACLWALKKFKNEISENDEIHMKADFIGVQNFNTGIWQTKAPYIKKIKDEIHQEIISQKLNGRIYFEWVKAHQTKAAIKTDRNAYWNDQVDSLAKTGKRL